MNDKVIRLAIDDDLNYIEFIERSSFGKHDRFNRQQLSYLIRGKGIFLICEVLCRPCAYIYISKSARIYSIASMKKGCGTLLLQCAEAIMLKRKKHYITLEVREDNKAAINFYTKNGYKLDGIKYNYYKDGTAAILFEKDLTCQKTG